MEKIQFEALSPQEVKHLWNNKMPSHESPIDIVFYDDIIRMNNIKDLFRRTNKVIIFYPSTPSYGHYCCLCKNDNTIYFFDSYGKKPDTQKNYAEDRNELYRERENSLIRLLLDSNYVVDYSDHVLQKGRTATCGRWCLLRCACAGMSNDEFAKQIKSIANYNNISEDMTTVKFFH